MSTNPGSQAEREIIQFLSRRPTPEEIIAFHPSEEATEHFYGLIYTERERELSEDESRELETCLYLEHFMRMMKIEARRQFGTRTS